MAYEKNVVGSIDNHAIWALYRNACSSSIIVFLVFVWSPCWLAELISIWLFFWIQINKRKKQGSRCTRWFYLFLCLNVRGGWAIKICNTLKVDLKLFYYYLPVGEKNVTVSWLGKKNNHIRRKHFLFPHQIAQILLNAIIFIVINRESPFIVYFTATEIMRKCIIRIIESPGLEKASKIIQSSCPATISISPLNHVP